MNIGIFLDSYSILMSAIEPYQNLNLANRIEAQRGQVLMDLASASYNDQDMTTVIDKTMEFEHVRGTSIKAQ